MIGDSIWILFWLCIWYICNLPCRPLQSTTFNQRRRVWNCQSLQRIATYDDNSMKAYLLKTNEYQNRGKKNKYSKFT